MPTATTNPSDLIGRPINRVDGRAKVTGAAKYAAEHAVNNVAHAVAITSTIALGTITQIDTRQAESMPGVLAVLTHQNTGKMALLTRDDKKLVGQPGQTMPVLQNGEIHYGGQYVAVVVAESLEQAKAAAAAVKFNYTAATPNIDMTKPIGPLAKPAKVGAGEKPDHTRGDPDGAFAAAPVKVQQTYTTANQTHNPMEMHSTIAAWEGDRLTLYDSTQHIMGVKSVVAAILEIPEDSIRVICPFLGGGFGCKGSIWPNTALAAIAARRVNRPVKLMLLRDQMFTQVGFRPKTIQKIALGADHTGKLISTAHDTVSQTSDFDDWAEPSGKATKFLYACPNLRVTQMMARVNTGSPCQMRAPGEATGSFAMEMAMDELAYAAAVDPLQLRLINYSDKDESENKPYSSKGLRDCYRAGAEKFGWANRKMAPRSMQQGKTLIGWGMATSSYPTMVMPCAASARLYYDGRAVVTASTHDLGTGTYTIMTQVAAQVLGLPLEKVKFELGDSTMPKAPVSGGSMSAASVSQGVVAACKELIGKLAKLVVADPKSPLNGKDPANIYLSADRILVKGDDAIGEPIGEFFSRNQNRPIEANAQAKPPEHAENFSKHAWGAQFVEVRVNERLGEIRVTRVVGAFSAGRILNAKTAHSQIMGGIVMGIGAALFENTVYDPQSGRVINSNLADYLVPINADIAEIDCFFVPEEDSHINTLGVKGVGELGITGIAGAVANAVFHATGKRVRDLPITLDMLL